MSDTLTVVMSGVWSQDITFLQLTISGPTHVFMKSTHTVISWQGMWLSKKFGFAIGSRPIGGENCF
jgi:hypothetical protein